MVEEHGEAMSQRDRANARTLHLDFRPESGPSRAGGRGFSLPSGPPASGRIEAPQAQQLAAPPMNAAQAAQQRRQVQTDQREESTRRRNFDTGLSGSNSGRASPAPASGRQSPEESGSGSGFNTPREDVDNATALRHAALLSRMSMLVNDSSTKLASFRSSVRQFKNNESSAKDMLDTLFNVLDQDPEATSGVVREIANLFDAPSDRDKQKAILEALNAFRIEIQEQFPALGGAPTGLGSNWAGVSSGRILSAKRATHTGRGNLNSRTVWDRVEAAAASHPANRPTTGVNGRHVPGAGGAQPTSFPALGANAAAGSSRGAVHSTPWASGGGGGSSSKAPSALVPQIRSVNFPTVSSSKPTPVNKASFPSLPSSSSAKSKAAERAALFSKPTPREESIARIRGTAPPAPKTNNWGVASASNGMASMSVDDSDAPVEEPKPASKKKGKQKQLLFTVSARPS